MAERNHGYRDADELGSRSPVSKEAKQQGEPEGTHTRAARHGQQLSPGDRSAG